ncbi:MAG: acylphosphatase [Desulfurococcales archaeon]|nr:acylphosphatase [Desulfurococcales archaeon]
MGAKGEPDLRAGEMVRAHLIVRGLVQGVFFRANMRRVALENGVTGWVRNLPDGRTVEAVLEGPREAVERVVCWSLRGPPLARVAEARVEFQEYRGEYSTFEIRY